MTASLQQAKASDPMPAGWVFYFILFYDTGKKKKSLSLAVIQLTGNKDQQ